MGMHMSTIAHRQLHSHHFGMSGMQEFGALVKSAREAKGLTLEEAGRRLGRPHTYLGRFENGKNSNPPDPESFRAICHLLGLSMRTLVEALGYLDPVELEPGVVYEIREGDARLPLLRALDAMTPAGMARFVEMFTPVAEKFTAAPELQEGKSRA